MINKNKTSSQSSLSLEGAFSVILLVKTHIDDPTCMENPPRPVDESKESNNGIQSRTLNFIKISLTEMDPNV